MPSFLTSKVMWRAILCALILNCLSDIVGHYLWAGIDYGLPEDTLEDLVNEFQPPSLCWNKVPRTAIWSLLWLPLDYRWQCLLERRFPARRRGGLAEARPHVVRDKPNDADTDDEMEERVLQKLIAKGKVKRAGLSWLNTFVKWVLDITLMKLVNCVLWNIWVGIWNRRSLSDIDIDPATSIIPMYVFALFSFNTFASLVAFTAIPVQHRLPFKAGLDLASTTFIAAFANAVIPWILTFDVTKEAIQNGTEALRLAKNATAHSETVAPLSLQIDP